MRLFVAIELTEPMRAALGSLQSALRPRCEGVRWIPVEQLHLTLKFIGEVREGDVPRMGEAIRRVAENTRSSWMELAGCGCFPPRGPVRIVWAGIREESDTLVRCAAEVSAALEPFGVEPERQRFSPHITVGRVREDRTGGALRAEVGRATVPIRRQDLASLTLMSSVLSPKGPTYAPVAVLKLTSSLAPEANAKNEGWAGSEPFE